MTVAVVKVGARFGHLVVEAIHPGSHTKHKTVQCRCACGKQVVVDIFNLARGRTRSCGCKTGELLAKHHMYNTNLYHVYSAMIQRCYNHNCPAYRNYGARGISVCQAWREDARAFLDWARAGYRQGLTLDRIDNDGNYCPENCRWVTHQVQQTNKRTSRLVESKGETHCVSEWARLLGVHVNTLDYRLKHWGVKRAIGGQEVSHV